MTDVFISYASANRDHVAQLEGQLRNSKYDVWRDTGLIPQGMYSDQITAQINDAFVAIVVWSNEAAASDWVRSEANEALRQKKLINVSVPGFDKTAIPKPYDMTHCVDVTDYTAIEAALRSMNVPRGHVQMEPVTKAALLGDELLPFLNVCTTEELRPLVEVIDKAWNADRLYEKPLSAHPDYPQHAVYVLEIERRFRMLGGHAVANVLRDRQGPAYRSVVVDLYQRKAKPDLVARATALAQRIDLKPMQNLTERLVGTPKADASAELPPIADGTPVRELEKRLLVRTFDDLFAKMTADQKQELAREINDELERRGERARFDPRAKGPALALVTQYGIAHSGFFIYRAAAILLNAFSKAFLSRGLTFAANAGVMRTIGVATGPVGWVATGLYTLYETQTPAYQSVEQGVLVIAALREMKLNGLSAANAGA